MRVTHAEPADVRERDMSTNQISIRQVVVSLRGAMQLWDLVVVTGCSGISLLFRLPSWRLLEQITVCDGHAPRCDRADGQGCL